MTRYNPFMSPHKLFINVKKRDIYDYQTASVWTI